MLYTSSHITQVTYEAYRKNKEVKNGVNFNSHLTSRRGTLLYETKKLADKIEPVDFVYANINGDICARLKQAVNRTEVIKFKMSQQFMEKMSNLNAVELDDDGSLWKNKLPDIIIIS